MTAVYSFVRFLLLKESFFFHGKIVGVCKMSKFPMYVHVTEMRMLEVVFKTNTFPFFSEENCVARK